MSEGVDGLVTGAIAEEGRHCRRPSAIRLTCLAVEAAAERIPVLAVTGANSTATSIELTRAAKTAGAAAAVLVTPYSQQAEPGGHLPPLRGGGASGRSPAHRQ